MLESVIVTLPGHHLYYFCQYFCRIKLQKLSLLCVCVWGGGGGGVRNLPSVSIAANTIIYQYVVQRNLPSAR